MERSGQGSERNERVLTPAALWSPGRPERWLPGPFWAQSPALPRTGWACRDHGPTPSSPARSRGRKTPVAPAPRSRLSLLAAPRRALSPQDLEDRPAQRDVRPGVRVGGARRSPAPGRRASRGDGLAVPDRTLRLRQVQADPRLQGGPEVSGGSRAAGSCRRRRGPVCRPGFLVRCSSPCSRGRAPTDVAYAPPCSLSSSFPQTRTFPEALCSPRFGPHFPVCASRTKQVQTRELELKSPPQGSGTPAPAAPAAALPGEETSSRPASSRRSWCRATFPLWGAARGVFSVSSMNPPQRRRRVGAPVSPEKTD